MTSRWLLVAAIVLSIVSVAHAEVELKNDGFVSGGMANFQTGFVVNEAGASRFVAASAGRQLLKLQLLWGGATTTERVTIKVFDDTAGTDVPGAELFAGEIELTGSDSAMQEIDLSVNNIIVPAQFRVAIVFQHAGAPAIASDGDATVAADKNFLLAAGVGWKKSSDLGITGDWVIRAFVTDVAGPDPGMFCDTNPDCPSGQICDAPHHACITGCRSDDECSSNMCSSAGQCTAGATDDGGCRTGGDGAGGGAAFALGALALALIAICKRGR